MASRFIVYNCGMYGTFSGTYCKRSERGRGWVGWRVRVRVRVWAGGGELRPYFPA